MKPVSFLLLAVLPYVLADSQNNNGHQPSGGYSKYDREGADAGYHGYDTVGNYSDHQLLERTNKYAKKSNRLNEKGYVRDTIKNEHEGHSQKDGTAKNKANVKYDLYGDQKRDGVYTGEEWFDLDGKLVGHDNDNEGTTFEHVTTYHTSSGTDEKGHQKAVDTYDSRGYVKNTGEENLKTKLHLHGHTYSGNKNSAYDDMKVKGGFNSQGKYMDNDEENRNSRRKDNYHYNAGNDDESFGTFKGYGSRDSQDKSSGYGKRAGRGGYKSALDHEKYSRYSGKMDY